MDEVTAAELKARIAAGQVPGADFTLLDVREPAEVAAEAIEGSLHVPLGEVVERMDELDPAKETVVYCAAGVRSELAVRALRAAGFKGRLVNLTGGMKAWNQAVWA